MGKPAAKPPNMAAIPFNLAAMSLAWPIIGRIGRFPRWDGRLKSEVAVGFLDFVGWPISEVGWPFKMWDGRFPRWDGRLKCGMAV